MARPRIVIAGAGVAGLEALAYLHAHDVHEEADLVVVAPAHDFSVRALGVGEPFGLGRPHRWALSELVPRLGGTFVPAGVDRVEASLQRVVLSDGATPEYDALLVAVGSRQIAAYEHGISFDRVRAPGDFDDALADLRTGLVSRVAVVVAPELAWTLPAYELALLLRADAPDHGRDVTLVSSEHRPLAAFGATASDHVAALLDRQGVRWRGGRMVRVVSDTTVQVDGRWHETDRVVHLPVALGVRLAGLPCDRSGFIEVDAAGRVPGDGGVWAAGDGTVAGGASGGVAAQLAVRAAADLVADVLDRRLPPTAPLALCGLLRTGEGPLYLRAELADPDGTSAASRSPLWWPAGKVAAPWLTTALVTPGIASATRRPTAATAA